MTVVLLSAGERPQICSQPQVPWPSMISCHIHPLKIAAVEALRWIGGPLSAKELWLMGLGEPEYGNVAYHVKALVDLGLIQQTHERPARGTMEKFYVLPSTSPVA
jgi:hypothetical protein